MNPRKTTRRKALALAAAAMPAFAQPRPDQMDLGVFSISLAVKDLAASRKFYEKLGFKAFAGDGKRMQIMKNGDNLIGLFQGAFEKNILTFNPGWDANAKKLAS